MTCLFLVALTMVSCKQKNISGEKGGIRTDLVSMDFTALDEYVRNLSPEEKANLWKVKIQDTLESGNLSEAEKNTIREFSGIIDDDCYEFGSAQSQEACEKSENLELTLIENFGWDEKKLFHYLGIVLTEDEIAIYNEKHGTDF